eukprot:2521938-Pyramimonas_sp.AAC.1
MALYLGPGARETLRSCSDEASGKQLRYRRCRDSRAQIQCRPLNRSSQARRRPFGQEEASRLSKEVTAAVPEELTVWV